MFTDRSLFLPLLAYGLTKYTNDNTRSSSHFLSPLLTVRVPLMSGFFATYLPSEPRPLHSVSFLTPINEDPSSESTAEKCLEDTKELFVDSNYQKEGILVVDEKIYRSCLKVNFSLLYFSFFTLPSDVRQNVGSRISFEIFLCMLEISI
jgi:hypothetical protein